MEPENKKEMSTKETVVDKLLCGECVTDTLSSLYGLTLVLTCTINLLLSASSYLNIPAQNQFQ